MNFEEVERKWREVWEKEKIFEAEPNNNKKFYITAAFPYPNSPQHIGHARTFGTADVYARFKRLQGFNVLFPMGFHVTGTPSLAMAKRIKRGEEEIIETFEKIYGIKKEEIEKMGDPAYLVDYFSKEIEEGMREMGFAIDWRRKFRTYDKHFNKFVEWQFRKLYNKGYLEKGEHPVAWCENEKNPVGAHDTKHDIDPEIAEAISIKFKLKDEDAYLLCMTFRPETLFGVTNLWINENEKYEKVEINNETYYIAKKAVWYLNEQLEIKEIEEVDPKKLLKRTCINPITKEEISIEAAPFVDAKYGTGVVMSVPAHDVYDYTYFKKLGLKKEIRKVLQAKEIKIEGKSYKLAENAIPSEEILKIEKDLEKAKAILYREEARNARMIVGEGYIGLKVEEAREKIKNELYSKNLALRTFVLANGPIFCRCGTEVKVKIVKDQWFINYGNEEWKKQAKEALKQMRIVPEKVRENYLYTIDWLNLRPCARNEGFGTRLPFDQTKIIEPLSDSTIYMAFYTISHVLKNYDADKLCDEFFDYVFLGKGDVSEVSKKTNIPVHEIQRMRESFLYWYPLDSRHSGPDLITNHLTMFIFNHVAVFPKELWPKQIVTNGFVLRDGVKMSKSLGNILPLRKAIKEYGADVVRFSVTATGELFGDSDFNTNVAKGVRERIEYFEKVVKEISEANKNEKEKLELKRIDYWLYSKLNSKIKEVEKAYEELELREVAKLAFYDAYNELLRYFERGGNNKLVLKEYLEKTILMLEPLLPYTCEEFWSILGHNELIENQRFPKSSEELIDKKIEAGEEEIENVIEDIKNVIKIFEKKNIKPKKAKIVVASKKKHEVYEKIMKCKSIEEARKVVEKLQGEEKEIAARMIKNFPLKEKIEKEEEFDALQDAKDYISKKLSLEVEIENEEESKEERAKQALPMKPAIILL
jgi:leucyl-tRNA synthetase